MEEHALGNSQTAFLLAERELGTSHLVPGKNNEITLLWINNFDFVCVLPIAPIAAQRSAG